MNKPAKGNIKQTGKPIGWQPIISINQARKILGANNKEMSDAQIADTIYNMQSLVDKLLHASFVPKIS